MIRRTPRGPASVPAVLGIALLVITHLPAPAPAAQPLVVGVEDIDYYPLYNGRLGSYQGFARELLDAFGLWAGYEIDYRPLPPRRLYSEFLDRRRVDFKYPANPQWRADMKQRVEVVYSDTTVRYVYGVVVPADRRGRPLEDIDTLSLVHGSKAQPAMDRFRRRGVELAFGPTYPRILEMVARGRADGAYGNIAVAGYHLSVVMGRGKEFSFDPSLPHTEGGYRLATISRPEVVEEFNRFLRERAGAVQALRRRYGVEPEIE
jgi:hypothetical protein